MALGRTRDFDISKDQNASRVASWRWRATRASGGFDHGHDQHGIAERQRPGVTRVCQGVFCKGREERLKRPRWGDSGDGRLSTGSLDQQELDQVRAQTLQHCFGPASGNRGGVSAWTLRRGWATSDASN